jgi:alkane 1-monooxygenase
VALVPPLWFRLMDKRVVAHYEGDVTLANIHPPKRNKILARWSSVAV